MSSITEHKKIPRNTALFSVFAVVPAVIAITVFQIYRLWPALPTVLQDEYVYSVGSKYGGAEEAARFGNFLYYELYRVTVHCGPEFYSCARVINGFWYVGLLLVLYAYSMRYFSRSISLLLVVSIGLGPFGLYVSLFMPEVMAYFFVSLGILFFTAYWESTIDRVWSAPLLLAFAAIGIGSLVKPHAAFLAIGLIVLMVVKALSLRNEWVKTIKQLLSGLGIFAFVKFSIGFMLAGSAGLTMFGNSYTGALTDFFSDLLDGNSTGSNTVSGAGEISPDLNSQSILGYLDVLTIHFGVLLLVIAMMMGPLLGTLIFRGDGLWKDPFTLLGSQVIIVGGIVSVFAAHVTAQGDDHSDRLLLRYFEYLVPFMFILGIHKAQKYKLRGWRQYVSLVFATLSIIIIFTNIQERQWGIVDSAFLYSIFSSQDSQWLWAAAIAIMTYLIFVPTRLRLLGALSVLAGAIAIVGQMGVSNQLQINSTKVASDYAGEFVYENFPEVRGEDILVLGSNRKLVEASMFAIDKANIDFQLLPEGSVLSTEAVSDDYKLVVETTGVFLDRDGGTLITGEGFAVTLFD